MKTSKIWWKTVDPRSLILSVINTKKTKAHHSQTAKRWQQAREEQYVTFQET